MLSFLYGTNVRPPNVSRRNFFRLPKARKKALFSGKKNIKKRKSATYVTDFLCFCKHFSEKKYPKKDDFLRFFFVFPAAARRAKALEGAVLTVCEAAAAFCFVGSIVGFDDGLH